MKKWRILGKEKRKKQTEKTEDVIKILLENRGLNTKKLVDDFLSPDLSQVSLVNSGIDKKEFTRFKDRIEKAILENEKVIIFGDYDVDGICGTAILWETLFQKTKNVLPYIPERIEEGYGLSIKGIDNVLNSNPDTKLIITVDNGIVAHKAIEYAAKKEIDVIVSDHHVMEAKAPDAFCVLHTTKLCGAGIAYILAKELGFSTKEQFYEALGLAALATVADLVPLTENNRIIVKHGLEVLRKTKRLGLRMLYEKASVKSLDIDVYKLGYIIAPRLNATGRISHAMDALRLICTSDKEKAEKLSHELENLNKERRELTEKSVEHARLKVLSFEKSKLLVVSDKSYNQGVIGLIASRLVESFYKPALVLSVSDDITKGSARSVGGVNIIELIRSVSSTLVEAGGHPMAAGFSIKTERIDEFTSAISKKAEEVVLDEHLERQLDIDCLLPFALIDEDLLNKIREFEPFGIGNPQPVFASKDVRVFEVRKIGKDMSHLKLRLKKDGMEFDAIAFGYADKLDLAEGSNIDAAYVVEENEWNGKKSLQLKIKDLKLSGDQ